jgi:hypothetical protein
MFSLLSLAIVLLLLCYFVFAEIRSKFHGYDSNIRKHHIYIGLLLLIISIAFFGYETNTYKLDDSLPASMNTITKSVTMNVSNIKNINISTNAKFKNVEVVVDNSLTEVIRVEVNYFKTAEVSYVSYFDEGDDLRLKFDGETNFKFENCYDVFQLGVETIRTKTMYNYNMFKYPKVKIYAGVDTVNRINLD